MQEPLHCLNFGSLIRKKQHSNSKIILVKLLLPAPDVWKGNQEQQKMLITNVS